MRLVRERLFELIRTDGIAHTTLTLPTRVGRVLASRVRDRVNSWKDASIDRKYKIDTVGIDYRLREAGAAGENVLNGTFYQAIQLDVWRAIDSCLNIRAHEFTFVDLGSGKGRALIFASLKGYKKVVGVEFAPAFCELSLKNLDQFRKLAPSTSPIEVICQDAVTYRFPDDDLVVFLYNPFDDIILAKVIANLEESLRVLPRRAIIIYRNPVHSGVIRRSSLSLVQANKSFELYSNRQDFRNSEPTSS